MAGTLSGGEQQMLAIGRCLMGAPDLVMFDEPSLGLAPTLVQSVLRCVRDLNREGLTCVLVEQNVAVSLKLASRAYVLENGRITLSGSGEALLTDDRVRQAYLGLVGLAEAARAAAHQTIERGDPHAERALGETGAQQLERFGVGRRCERHHPRGHLGRIERRRRPMSDLKAWPMESIPAVKISLQVPAISVCGPGR